jgi:hypothetical protein
VENHFRTQKFDFAKEVLGTTIAGITVILDETPKAWYHLKYKHLQSGAASAGNTAPFARAGSCACLMVY